MRKNKNKSILATVKEYFVWILLAGFVVVNIFSTIETATTGAEIMNLEEKQETLIRENRTFSDQIVNQSSLMTIETKAQELGYSKPQNVIYIAEKEVVAKLP